MARYRPQARNTRSLAMPVAWIIGLLASYWLIAEWQTMPRLFASMMARIG